MADELSALERNLKDATEAFQKADQEESAARRAACDAKNALNAAQRQLDAHLKKLRDGAPRDSDWGRERQHKFAVKEQA